MIYIVMRIYSLPYLYNNNNFVTYIYNNSNQSAQLAVKTRFFIYKYYVTNRVTKVLQSLLKM